MLECTSTKWALWFVIPADYKWVARALTADIITANILSLDIKYPDVDEQKLREIEAAKRKLESE